MRYLVPDIARVIFSLFSAVPEDALKVLNDSSLGQDMADPDVRLHRKFKNHETCGTSVIPFA